MRVRGLRVRAGALALALTLPLAASTVPAVSASAAPARESARQAAEVRPLAVWTPTPAKAYGDKPSIYGTCHASFADTAPRACILGDKKLAHRRARRRLTRPTGCGVEAAAFQRLRVAITKSRPPQPVSASQPAQPQPYARAAPGAAVLADLARWKPSNDIAGSHSRSPRGAGVRRTDAAHQRDLAWEATAALLTPRSRCRRPVVIVVTTPRSPGGTCWPAAGTRPAPPDHARALRAGVRATETPPSSPRWRLGSGESTHLRSARTCLPAADGVLRYRDAGHLTRTFGRTQVKAWASVLVLAGRVLAAPPPAPEAPPAAPVLWPPQPAAAPPAISGSRVTAGVVA
jgi:hypothetical protein